MDRVKEIHETIIVQDEQFSIAQRGVVTSCAIAAAIMIQIPDARRIKVNQQEISWLDVSENKRYVFRTPSVAQSFIRNWDAGESCRPIGFTLTNAQLVRVREPKPKSVQSRIAASGRRSPEESCQQ